MAFNKANVKINNSYDSEPSSKSGSSSLGEQPDSIAADDENMRLPYLLLPTSYEMEPLPAETRNMQNVDRDIAYRKSVQQDQVLNAGALHLSSQESSFEGFNESPASKKAIERTTGKQQPRQLLYSYLTDPQAAGNKIRKNFYDVVEENSCNAVYLQLPNEICREPTSGDASSELSFNGRFNSCIYPTVVDATATASTPPMQDATRRNQSNLNESFMLKKYSNERSPDLFGDDDADDNDDNNNNNNNNMDDDKKHIVSTVGRQSIEDVSLQASSIERTHASGSNVMATKCSKDDDNIHAPPKIKTFDALCNDSQSRFHANCKREKELLQRIRKCLAGVPPPPALTIPQLDVATAVLSCKEQILSFYEAPINRDEMETSNTVTSLFKPTHTLEETKSMHWKDLLGVTQHGLSFNLNKASESNEYLSLSVIERFIGAETTSSYCYSPPSLKKRTLRSKMLLKSPGNRLSHLAKRRAIFSSANLATTTQKATSSLGTQIQLGNRKKNKNRRKGTPKKRTPTSKKKNVHIKTPSSARKYLNRCDIVKPAPTRESSKRALFQSPPKSYNLANTKPAFKPDIATRVERSKRALFSPEKYVDAAAYCEKSLDLCAQKRKRQAGKDDADQEDERSSKIFRSGVSSLTPRALKIKSQSFCIGAGASLNCSRPSDSQADALALNSNPMLINVNGAMASSSIGSSKMFRSYSENITNTNSLTENQRKKLLWAVSQALQERKVCTKHEKFKQYASVLARVVRRIFQEYYQKSNTSNSEIMLRLAKKYLHNVISGKDVDELYLVAKREMEDAKRKSESRLSGYIGPKEYENQRKLQQKSLQAPSSLHASMQGLCSVENTTECYSISPTMLSATSTSELDLPASSKGTVFASASKCESHGRVPIQPNAVLQNSSSKNNLTGLALRENVDCEQRRSAQKNFTGKDQRNVSPYAGGPTRVGSAMKAHPSKHDPLVSNTAKAKRQISFDS